MTSHLRSFAGGLAVTALVFLCPYTRGQEANLRQFDPSDVYFQAWLKIREGEEAEKEEKFLDAFNHYKKAASLFDTVGVYHPEWKPHLVKDRQATTRTSMDKIRDNALQEQRAQENKLDGIVLEGPGTAGRKPELGIKPLPPNEQRNLADLQRQIRSLQLQLKNAANDRDANAAQLKRALSQLETQRAQMARSPLKGQVAQMTTQIAELQKEREAMAQALHKSREEHQEALTLLTTREADQKAAHEKIAKQENLLNVQKNAANEVVQGLRDQLKDMKAIAAEKDRLLAQANADKEQLFQQLRESHAEIADLKEERGELLKDRDRMATLLQLNETDRVKVLIEQNMKLGDDLNLAKEQLADAVASNNTSAQELVEVKSQLAVAKSKINQLNTDYRSQAARLRDLEERLRNERNALAERSALAEGESPKVNEGNREEIAMLQGIIDRTLKVQSRRRKAQELLVETIKRKAIEDPQIWGALEMLGGQLVELTPEEVKLVENRMVDDEFIFSDPATPGERERATTQLQRNIQTKSNLAKRAFSNGRFLVAREFFESILDEHPGHVTTKLNLGVVHLRNSDPALAVQSFDDVITLRPEMPYAHFMLGVSHYQLGDYLTARESLQTSLVGDPTNAKAHVFIGSIAGGAGEIGNAEEHWQQAVKLDPTLSEPYYNLSILRLREGKKDEALKLYRQALENGRQPDLALEKQFGR